MHRFISEIFRNLKDTKSFYDDIYIFTKSLKIEEHLKALRETLDIFRENKLYFKLSKRFFAFGDFVSHNGIHMDPDKVQTIKDWPVPRTQEELHSFLGLTGYVQRFCPEYASLTATMFALLKKNKRNAKIQFSCDQLKNFKELKRRLCNPHVLYLLDFSKPMHLRTDASKFAVGGVLFQVVEDIERPIAYTNRKMKPAELNYPTQQQELLAIIHALAAFRIYCLDKPPIVETDHKSLEGLFTQKPSFSHLRGAKNGIADTLSRRPDLQPETKFFHDLSVTSFDDTSFTLTISEVTTNTELVTRIKKAYAKDREVQTISAAIKMRGAKLKPLITRQHRKMYRRYSEANGLLWYQTPVDDVPRIVVPNDVTLRQTIISECHDSNYSGHPGADRTYLAQARRWYWSRMLKSIQKFVADCEPCRRNKPRLAKAPGLLEPLRYQMNDGDQSPWNRLTKRCQFVPTTKKVTAEGVARLFIDHI
ncbi:Pol Polyprotein [Phytophthora megakarya]|uniref:Pol Polyprotein n=1 Tax=Phytophthora megakarya TaxID=4795 RepID=A0A225V7M6_9STRA|nr:Pol Polyprotein [Phytophthora megakarya]